MSHWRTMVQSENLCAADLWDEQAEKYQNAIVKIVSIAKGTVVGNKGRKKGLPFLTLENRRGRALRAPFGANPTNCTSIGSALGTPDVKKWIGQWIELYVTQVDSPSGMVDAIRIHPRPPEQPAAPASSSGPITRDQVEQSLKREGLIDQTSREGIDAADREFSESVERRKRVAEKALGRTLQGDDQLSEADKRAIELAEQEEARRGR